MKVEIEVISREMVTPSSPTPPHLKNYKLSFLDQIMPRVLMPPLLFYSANDHLFRNSETSDHLKKSLSKALTLFYPLAGRLVGNSYVNCNDEGVTYVEAQANHNLFDVITHPNPKELNKFVPCDPDDGKDLCLVAQATFFSCGGMAIGLGISHKVVDGFSTAMFFNTWAAFSRGDDLIQSPIFDSAILFPPNDLVSELVEMVKKEEIVAKMFTFSSQRISDLRDKCTKNTKDIEGLIRPTRIETLSAFIATRYMVATGSAKDERTRKVYALRIIVDIRESVVPPLTEYHCGNLTVSRAITLPAIEKKDEDGGYGIVKKTRDAIRTVKGDVLFSIKNRMENSEKSEAVECYFSSLCNFPFHKADFGWGIPVWMGIGSIPANNMVFFTNSLSRGGIDAIMNMKEEDMAKFETDEELLKYVSSGDEDKFLSKM